MKQLARDLAIVGGVSSVLAPAAFVLYRPVPAYFAAVVVAGVLTGALVAPLYASIVNDPRERPWTLLAGVGFLLGLLWGGAVGLVGAQAEPRHAGWSVILASFAAAVQLGLFGPFLARRAAAARPTWPLLLGATAVAPLLGNVGYVAVNQLGRWLAVLLDA